MSKYSPFVVRLLLVIPMLFLVGCPGPGWQVDQTSNLIRQYAVTPVFPFREDFQVGDIYQDPYGADDQTSTTTNLDASYPRIGVLIGTVAVSPELNQFYANRIYFNDTPLPPPASGETPQVVAPGSTSFNPGNGVFFGSAPASLQRLRVVAFPTFSSARTTLGQVNAFVPIHSAASIAAGLGATSSDSASISVPVAESYQVPAEKVIQDFSSQWGTGQALSDIVKHFAPPETSPKILYLRLVTEVYYARAIDLTIESSSSAGFSAVAKMNQLPAPALTPATPPTPPAPPAVPPASTPGTPPVPPSTPKATSASLVDALNQQLAGGDGDTSAPNVSLKFITASDTSVTLRAVFTRPVAIGFRGVLIKLTLKGGNSVDTDIQGVIQGDVASDMQHPVSTQANH